MTIMFRVQIPWQYRNWEPVLKHFDPDEILVHVTPWTVHLSDDPAAHARQLRETLAWLERRGADVIHGPWPCEPHVLATLSIDSRAVAPRWSKQVRMLYAVISKQYTYSAANKHYDCALVASEFGASLMARHGVRTQVIGYPKLDAWFDGTMTRETARAELGLPMDRTVVVYAPTFGELCAHDHYARALSELDLDADFLVQLHPVTYVNDIERFRSALPDARWIAPDEAGIHVLAAADAVITDYSGVTFEACAMDVPVLLLDRPGVPLTDDVEIRYRDAGPRVTEPGQLQPRLEELLASPERWAERRAHYRDTFFAHHGDAGRRAADAFRQLQAEAVRARGQDIDLIYSRMRALEQRLSG